MRLLVLAVGRLKKGPEAELAERYRARCAQGGRAIGLREFQVLDIKESRAEDSARRMMEESIALTTLIPERAITLLLDPRGENLSSPALAQRIAACRDGGEDAMAFVIGGPDGLAPSLTDRAAHRIAFGTATWPHQMVRIMLLEQLYRATTILSGHPYHRA